MACASIVALPRSCGAEGILGGIEACYMAAFVDLEVPEGSTNGEVYTVSVGGLVSAIGLVTDKSFVEIGLLKSSSGLAETLTKDATKGVAYFTQTFTLVLSGLTAENKTFVESVLNQPVAVVVKSRTGKYYVAGLNGSLELATSESGTGLAEGDGQLYNLTFTGIDNKLIMQVDPTIISTLLDAD